MAEERRGYVPKDMLVEGKEVPVGTSLSALKPMKVAKLPPLTVGIAAMLGPAFIWASISQGSGELIWWPYIAAKYGTAFLGILIPALLIQYWVNQEIIRYTALTGEGPWSALGRIGRWFTVPFWILAFFTFLWFGGYASAGGTAMRDLLGWPADPALGSRFWGLTIMVIMFVGLVVSRVVYKLVEWLMKVIMVVSIIGAIMAVLRPDVLSTAGTYLAALLNPFKGIANMLNPTNVQGWDPADTDKIVTGIAYAGMGGYLNLLYAYWMRDKGVGMSKWIGRVTSPITGEPEAIPSEGYVFEDTEENRRNWKDWLRYLRWDNGLAVAANGFTCLLMTWLGLAILHPQGVAPAGWKIAVEQARFLEVAWGTFGRTPFLITGFAFLGDTWAGLADGLAREYAEFFWTNFSWAKIRDYRWWYYFWLTFLAIVTTVTMFIARPDPLILIAGVVNIFAFAIFIPAYMYINYTMLPKVLPEWVRPSKATMVWLFIIWLIYLGTGVWYIALSPQRVPYLLVMLVVWIVVGGFFYIKDRQQPPVPAVETA